MHGDLNRIPIDQSLDALGLVTVGQLVCRVYVDLDLSAGGFFNELTELAAALGPGTGLGCGAGKVPGLLFPSKITVVLYGICTDAAVRFLGEDCDQVCCIFVALILQLFLIPLSYARNSILEGIYIHILVSGNGHSIVILPAVHDLLITGTVDVTLIINRFLACLIDHRLLLRCQSIINLLVDAEEQTVIICVP